MTSFPISGPLSLGDLLDRAFRLYRARFSLFVGTAAIFLVPMSILSGLLTGRFMTTYLDALGALGAGDEPPSDEVVFGLLGQGGSFVGGLLLMGLLTLVLNGLVTLALTGQSIAALNGESLSIRESVELALARFWTFVRMSILQGLAYFGATVAVMVPLFVLIFLAVLAGAAIGFGTGELNDSAGVIAAIGLTLLLVCGYLVTMVLVILPTTYLSARWVVATPALVDNGWGARTSLRRSWALTQGNVWRAVGYVFLLWLVGALVISLPVGVFQQILLILFGGSFGLVTAASTALSSLFSVLWVPFNVGALVLLYYDLRVRKESYDLELRIEEMAAALEDGEGSAGL